MRSIAAVTGARSDYGILLPLLRRIDSDPGLELQLIVSGAHLASDFGETVAAIEADGLSIADRVDCLLASDSPVAIAKSMGLGVVGYAQTLSRLRPDILVLVGDRFETLAAAVAAIPFNLPLAHLHGGELTEGAFDEQMRHALTKMSHFHFVTTAASRRRVIQMGEEPWRVTVSGAPALDNLRGLEPLSLEALERRIGIALSPAPVIVTYHPVTLEPEQASWQIGELLAAVGDIDRPLVLTFPNADTSNREIRMALERFAAGRPRTALVANLGTQAYFSLMAHAAAMVGNSSSGIIEAASFRLPVVNVGTRQGGRERGANVVDTRNDRAAIAAGLARGLSTAFRDGLRTLVNPYGDGSAADRIVPVLRDTPIDGRLIVKRFQTPDLAMASPVLSGETRHEP